MLVLAIETSGSSGSVALWGPDGLLEERSLSASGRRHARTLVPELGDLLRSHGGTPRDVTRLGVSVGPGSFTGLRVGIVCAKTFAYACGCELVAVDTFAAVAAALPDETAVWIIDDALRGDVYAARYVREDPGTPWRIAQQPGLLPLEGFLPLARGQLVSGPGLAKHADEFAASRLAPPDLWHPAAARIAQLAAAAELPGAGADPWTLEPFYIRRSAAEEKADAKT